MFFVVALGTISSMFGQVTYSQELERLAQAGDAQAIADLGYCYAYGEGVNTDTQKAIELYINAMTKGNVVAIRRLGHLYSYGNGVAQDFTMAFELYKKAAELGDADAMDHLGLMMANGEGTSQNYLKALEWFKKAAALGQPDAMFNLFIMFYNGEGVTKDINTALDWLVKRMEIIDDVVYNAIEAFQIVLRNENQKGEYNSRLRSYKGLFNLYKNTYDSNMMSSQDLFYGLAVFYAFGIGTEPSKAKAEEFIEDLRGCDAYHVCRAAEFYEYGDLGAVDYKKALEIYEECSWDVYSPAKAASFYIEGRGTTKNIPRALELIAQSKEYAEAAETSSPLADYLLGLLYYNGTDVKVNRSEAFKLFRTAAEDSDNPNDEAMKMMSYCYRFGFGVTKDLDKAEFWFKKAQDTGNEKARKIKQLLSR